LWWVLILLFVHLTIRLASTLAVHFNMLSPPLNSIHFLISKGAIKTYIIKTFKSFISIRKFKKKFEHPERVAAPRYDLNPSNLLKLNFTLEAWPWAASWSVLIPRRCVTHPSQIRLDHSMHPLPSHNPTNCQD
jgi:hypothetical protein